MGIKKKRALFGLVWQRWDKYVSLVSVIVAGGKCACTTSDRDAPNTCSDSVILDLFLSIGVLAVELLSMQLVLSTVFLLFSYQTRET